VVIGGSAGSLNVLIQILPKLNPDLPVAIVIVLHRKGASDSTLPIFLASRTTLRVKEAEEKEDIEAGSIYVAPADYHLLLEQDGTFSLDYSEKVNFSRPSIDITFESAADVYGSQLTGILLSGANADGARGLNAIKNSCGVIVVQDPASAEVAYMPQQAINMCSVDYVLDIPQLAIFINRLGNT
jgi:two-component system chemotaxis response regulator CheB